MILWFTILQMVVAFAGAATCLVVFLRKSAPNDYVLGATLLAGVLLLVQMIVAIIAPGTGNAPVGDPLEFWLYLIVALALPFAAGFWALVDRSRTANLVLAVVLISVAVMTYRMQVIWG